MKLKRVDLAFEPGEIVWIPALEAGARVTGVYISLYGVTYSVTYFIHGEQKTANLIETEILKDQNESG